MGDEKKVPSVVYVAITHDRIPHACAPTESVVRRIAPGDPIVTYVPQAEFEAVRAERDAAVERERQAIARWLLAEADDYDADGATRYHVAAESIRRLASDIQTGDDIEARAKAVP